MTPRLGDRRIPLSVKAEAAAWLARLHADDRSQADERGFRDWLGRAPEHRAAFDRLTTAWESAGALRAPADPVRAPIAVNSRRLVLASVASALAVGGVLTGRAAQAGALYETRAGEQRRVALEDGSTLLLDTATRVRVRFSEKLRQVDLECGRVSCRVTADPDRPFEVRAASARVVASHSAFSVRRDGEKVAVVALEGQVSVAGRPTALATHRTLTPGERLTTAPGAAAQVDRPPLAPLTAWQRGRAVFDNQPLAEAVTEMNRYSQIKLRIADPAVAEMRISGVYRLGANADFAHSIATLLPLAVEVEGEELRLAHAEVR